MKLSVFVIGPSKVGKTVIANYLADLSESLNYTDYHPTQGVRILETEKKVVLKSKSVSKEVDAQVEIWDLSGDPSYLPAWPSVSQDAHAVIYVCPEDGSTSDLDTWQSLFPQIKSSQVLFWVPKKSQKAKIHNKAWSKSPVVSGSLDQDSESIKTEFSNLLTCAYSAFQERIEMEEQNIMAAQV